MCCSIAAASPTLAAAQMERELSGEVAWEAAKAVEGMEEAASSRLVGREGVEDSEREEAVPAEAVMEDGGWAPLNHSLLAGGVFTHAFPLASEGL